MNTAQTSQGGTTHYAHIDGLRAVSVLVILLFHLGVSIMPGGFVGVDVFFVISGFLITGIIARGIAGGAFSFTDFYARRIRRIFPALFVMMAMASVGAILCLGPAEYGYFFKSLRMAAAQISNLHFAEEQDYFAAGHEIAPLLHTWSLGVEWQFYLIWPVLMVVLARLFGVARLGVILLALCVAGFAASIALLRLDSVAAFYGLPARAWELAIGGVVALGVVPPLSARLSGATSRARVADALAGLGLAMILAASFSYDAANFPGVKALLPCLGAALILYAAPHGAAVLRVLSLKPLVWVGLVSYSLYLWHWPLIAFTRSVVGNDLNLATQCILGAVSVLLAWASYRWIERPFLRRAAPAWRTVALGVLAIVLAVLASNVIKNESKADWRVTYQLDETVTSPNPLYDVCAVPGGAEDREHCIVGPNKDSYEVILVGDSHAAHYMPTVLDWARSRGLTVRFFLRGACQTWVKTGDVKMKAGKIDHDCIGLTEKFYDVLKTDSSIRYVFLGLMQIGGAPDVAASLAEIAAAGKTTVFLGRVPDFAVDPHHCKIRDHVLISAIVPRRESRDCLAFEPDHVRASVLGPRDVFLPVLQRAGIPYFDPVAFMPTAFDADGNFMYMDVNHLNVYGARHLSAPLAGFMKGLDQ